MDYKIDFSGLVARGITDDEGNVLVPAFDMQAFIARYRIPMVGLVAVISLIGFYGIMAFQAPGLFVSLLALVILILFIIDHFVLEFSLRALQAKSVIMENKKINFIEFTDSYFCHIAVLKNSRYPESMSLMKKFYKKSRGGKMSLQKALKRMQQKGMIKIADGYYAYEKWNFVIGGDLTPEKKKEISGVLEILWEKSLDIQWSLLRKSKN